VIEFREADRRIQEATVLGIEEFHGPPPERRMMGILIEDSPGIGKVHAGQDVWIVASPQREPPSI
jgi:hypothetical protein